MQRVVITVTGGNRPGVIAAITYAIARCNGNICDITQRIQGDLFVMLMVVDNEKATVSFEQFQKVLRDVSENLNIQIHVQLEGIFKYMHHLGS